MAVCALVPLAASREGAAHAVPVAVEPAENAVLSEAPHEVVMRFSERVDAKASTLEVLDGRGQRVPHGDATVDPADPWRYRVGVHGLEAGAYTVTWRVLSADDGHVTHGAHVFAVGTGTAPGGARPVAVKEPGFRPIARWLIVAGGALLLGVPAVGIWLRRELGRVPSPFLVWLGGGMILVGGTLDLALQARDLAGERPVAAVLAVLLTTRSGVVWLSRGVLLLLMAAFWIIPRAGSGGRWRHRIGLGLAAAVVISGGLVTHSATVVEGRALAFGAEAIHLLAMALWIGGLVGFGVMLWHGTAMSAARVETRELALAIPTFSQLAIPAVGALSLSGLVLARLHLTAWDELVRTPYGRWLAAKLVVFAAMLALGAYHQRRIHRRLRNAVADGRADAATVTRFRRSLRIEAGLGLVALVLAAVLASTSPTPPAVAGTSPGFHHERTFAEAQVRLEVTPLRPGPNTIQLTVMDPAGDPLADAVAAMVQLVPAAGGVGPVTFPLPRTRPGAFGVSDAVLGIVGRWDGRLVIQRDGAYDINDRFELVLTELPPSTRSHEHGRSIRPDAVTVWSTAGITLAAAVLWAGSWRMRRTTRRLVADADHVSLIHPQGGTP